MSEGLKALMAMVETMPDPEPQPERELKNRRERELHRYLDRSIPDVWLDKWDAMAMTGVNNRSLQRWRRAYRLKGGKRTAASKHPEQVYSRRSLARCYFAAKDALAATAFNGRPGPGRPSTLGKVRDLLAVYPGMTPAEVAHGLSINPSTARKHMRTIKAEQC
ncbi:hypothetical protein HLB23_04725 [Nocardia uniformis]|uniref:Uncharacterized protein n=1 Tax=Nocardia uniformis TaxID=53432 RepID=A0A849C2G1_9NOCA|nr:hypothetical protein [Nocardia uniformis]NNH69179.1 hypothetical protein [Nocardia uniformis]